MHVVDAVYGEPRDIGSARGVLDVVLHTLAYASGNSFVVTSSNLGVPDPAVGRQKALIIRFCNGFKQNIWEDTKWNPAETLRYLPPACNCQKPLVEVRVEHMRSVDVLMCRDQQRACGGEQALRVFVVSSVHQPLTCARSAYLTAALRRAGLAHSVLRVRAPHVESASGVLDPLETRRCVTLADAITHAVQRFHDAKWLFVSDEAALRSDFSDALRRALEQFQGGALRLGSHCLAFLLSPDRARAVMRDLCRVQNRADNVLARYEAGTLQQPPLAVTAATAAGDGAYDAVPLEMFATPAPFLERGMGAPLPAVVPPCSDFLAMAGCGGWSTDAVSEMYSSLAGGDTRSTADLALCTAFFNPVGWARPLENLRVAVKAWAAAGPVFVIELLYGTQKTALGDLQGATVFTVHCGSKMFHKENLWNLLESRVPPQFQKLLFLDADVVFQEADWYTTLSRALDSADAVHPFATITRLGHPQVPPSVESTFDGVGVGFAASRASFEGAVFKRWGHPGFGLGVNRAWLRRVGGFIEWAIMGGGDLLTLFALSGESPREHPSFFKQLYVHDDVRRFTQATVGCRFTYAPLHMLHMYHGDIGNRSYTARYDLTQSLTRQDFKKNADGCIEFLHPARWNPVMEDYFRSRDEDA